MANTQLLKGTINKITKSTIKQAIYLAICGRITSRAPLSYSGQNIRLYGKQLILKGRNSIFEIRNHSGMISVLITDEEGDLLVNVKYHPDLGFELVANKIWDDFKTVEKYINTSIKRISLKSYIQNKRVKPIYGLKKIVKKQNLIFGRN